ncbi:MAG TPA: hypothetical protein VG842_08720, partial [Sediminibacterium sp.]|nr:hypothetical protein [Sediminibacterium sp.]
MRIFSFLLLLAPLSGWTQGTANQQLSGLYQELNSRFQPDNAYRTTGFVEQYWRIAGNTGFNATVFELEKQLQAAGFKKQIASEAEAPLTYRIEKRAMQRPTWEPVKASIAIAEGNQVVLESTSNRNMQVVNSGSTPDGGITAELVYVGHGTPAECKEKDLKGKIVLGEASAAALLRNTRSLGVAGVLSYSMPKYTQPAVNTHSIQFQQIAMTDSAHQPWALAISYAALQELKKHLASGTLQVHV